MYNNYPELRPYQFISLNNLIHEGCEAVTNRKILELSPKEVLSKSKIYNIVSALQYRDLFGVDVISEFKANNSEMKFANRFYDEYLEKKDRRNPGEEYELVQEWGDDLKFNTNFELISEDAYRKRTDPDKMLESISEDPFDMYEQNTEKAKATEDFLNNQKAQGINMAVVMYMVDALKYFDEMSKDELKKIAFEIALLGRQGFHPEKKGYKISLISGKEFSGYHILAYYYVSWKIAIPEMLEELKLPYDDEYNLAEKMFRKGEI